MEPNITLVTGLWDLKRHELAEGWSRGFEEHYIPNFKKLLEIDCNFIIFIPESLNDVVWSIRDKENTFIINWDLEKCIKEFPFYDKVQQIRTDTQWYNQSSWLPDSTQARLKDYNTIVMSKMFRLHDAKCLDPFNSTHLFWIDAGLTNTVHPGYFTHDKVLDKLHKYTNRFTFISFPYDGKVEIHGFKYPDICRYSGIEVNEVTRGGFFGGPKDTISTFNEIYYSLLADTLSENLMGTEESIFTIITHKYRTKVNNYLIENNGLLYKFFEDLKNDILVEDPLSPEEDIVEESLSPVYGGDINKLALYVLTYNSPEQFEKLCMSFELYDSDFITKTKKYLLNNSLDRTTDEKYDQLCQKYGFEEIHKDNLGICGGRQFIAEHFDTLDLDYYFFFEDDMFFYTGSSPVCRNGFIRKVDNLCYKVASICSQEGFDFIKFNFSEFFGDNSVQWSWYNVPQDVRKKFWPKNNKLPEQGQAKNAPKVEYKNIKSFEGLPYATGEIFYCNWPQIVSKQGNKKMFLTTTWAHPFEQTWMSYIYQETKKGKINPGILLATPTEHDRFDHYDRSERKES